VGQRVFQPAGVVATHGVLPSQLRREAATMGLYVSIVLLAALMAVGDQSDADELAIIWGSTLGLALAHWFSFAVAAYLVDDEPEEEVLGSVLAVQLGAAGAIAAEATLAVWMLPEKWELDGARLVTACSIGLIVYVLARKGGRPAGTSAAIAFAAFVIGVGVAGVKFALTH
jgi:hypothetical protein